MLKRFLFIPSNDVENRRFLLFVFILGFAIRLAFILTLESGFYFSDSLEYEDCAMQILNGDGFGDYKREPLYPVWIAFVYLLFGGKSLFGLRLMESALSALLGVVIFFVGRKLFNPKIGMIASLVSVVYPIFIFLSGLAYPTLLSTLFIILATYFTLQIDSQGRKVFSATAGGMLGLAALSVAPTATIIGPIIVWVLLSPKLQFRARIIHSGSILLAFLLVLTPWILRNYQYHNKFVPIRQGAHHNIFNDGSQKLTPGDLHENNEGKRAFVDTFKRTLKYNIHGFLQFWRLSPNQTILTSANPNYNLDIYQQDKRITKANKFSKSKLTFVLGAVTFGPVLFLALLACVFLKRFFRSTLLLVSIILTLAVTYSFFYVKVRYRIPVEPLLVILAVHGFIQSVEFIRRKAMNQSALVKS